MANDTIDLEELYRSYFPKIYNFFFYKLLHREDAEDLTAKTFLKIAEHLHTYHSEKAKAGTWAWRIAENTLIDFYRTQKRHLSTDDEQEALAQALSVSFDEQYEQIASPKRRALYAALRQLPERDRMLVCYKYLLGWSYHEIAEKLQISCANTSRIRSFDAKRLHQLVKGAYIHDSNDFSPEKPGAHRIARSA